MSRGRLISGLRSLVTRRVFVELMQIVVVSSAVGIAFNVTNPIGLRWSAPATPQPERLEDFSKQPQVPQGSLFRNRTLSLEVLAVAPMISRAVLSPPVHLVPTAVTWSEAKPLLDRPGAVLVDARPKNYFDAGHIPGAVSLSESSSEPELAAFRAQHDADAFLLIYCGSPACPASKRLAETLVEKYGYRNVRYLPGGFQEWQRAELSGAANSSQR